MKNETRSMKIEEHNLNFTKLTQTEANHLTVIGLIITKLHWHVAKILSALTFNTKATQNSGNIVCFY